MADIRPQIVPAGGLPTGTKEAGRRVDFKPDNFSLAIATKGYRMWWSRAGICPCRNNLQTDQPQTTCELCKGHGYFYFLPEVGLDKYTTDSHGNPIQLNAAKDAVLVQAIMTSATSDPQVYERFGEWLFGTVKITVEHGNKLSYRDRLVCADALMAWSQLIEYDGGETIPVSGGYFRNGLRYPAVGVNLLRSVSSVYLEGEHWFLTDAGAIQWLAPAAQRPESGAMLTAHYTFAPVYRIIDHVYAIRDSLVAQKTGAGTLADQVRKLPVHAMAKLDFLVEEPTDA